MKHGPFEITRGVAEEMLSQPNPHGKPNGDIVKPWMIGRDINQTSRNMWIIDFGTNTSEADSALYEVPFEYVRSVVKPQRISTATQGSKATGGFMGVLGSKCERRWQPCHVTSGSSQVARHRLFSYIDGSVLPDKTIIVFARDDDYFFGVLHSRIHIVWARATGTQLRNLKVGLVTSFPPALKLSHFLNPTRSNMPQLLRPLMN